MDIREMKSGRELDEMVGKAIGVKPTIEWWGMDKEEKGIFIEFLYQNEAEEWLNGILSRGKLNSIYEGVHIVRKEIYKQYSESISAAWEVVKKFYFHIENVGYGDKKYHVTLDMHRDYGDYGFYKVEAYGETGPLAICRSALLAMEEKSNG